MPDFSLCLSPRAQVQDRNLTARQLLELHPEVREVFSEVVLGWTYSEDGRWSEG